MMKRRGANAAMDRISELPQFIIHQILSYLSTKEAAQTSVLSKTWLQASSTSPILILKDYIFCKSGEYDRLQFFSFVNNTLLRYRTLNLSIHKFEISLHRDYNDHASTHGFLDQSIGTALDHGVKELHISMRNREDRRSSYTLPQTIFSTSAKALTLTKLSVTQCNFPQNFASNITINFPYLKTLIIRYAHIDDGMLQKLLSSCPSVEKINFHWVSGFKKFLVSNLGQLKILDITSGKKVELLIEDAPSLHFFHYCFFHYCVDQVEFPCYLQVGSAQNLKHLVLDGLITITNNFLNELITKFPFLEVLNIVSCNGLERINVLGRSLKQLLLRYCENLVEANIDAPNLITLTYYGFRAVSLSLVNTPEELMTSVYIAHPNFGWPDIAWFHQLRERFKSISRAYITFHMCDAGVRFVTDMDLIANPFPLENFLPDISQSSSVFAAFVENLFSSFRPTTISTPRKLTSDKVDFIKFLGNELIMARRNSNCCSSNEETKCWRHYLKDIKVEVYKNSDNPWQPLPCETFLDKSIFINRLFRFSLKWNANINAPY